MCYIYAWKKHLIATVYYKATHKRRFGNKACARHTEWERKRCFVLIEPVWSNPLPCFAACSLHENKITLISDYVLPWIISTWLFILWVDQNINLDILLTNLYDRSLALFKWAMNFSNKNDKTPLFYLVPCWSAQKISIIENLNLCTKPILITNLYLLFKKWFGFSFIR